MAFLDTISILCTQNYQINILQLEPGKLPPPPLPQKIIICFWINIVESVETKHQVELNK